MTSRSASALRKPIRSTQAQPAKKVCSQIQIRQSCRNGTWPISIPASTRRKSTRDLDKLDTECVAFETDYKGKLAEQTAREQGGEWLAEAVRRYEAIDDLAGRLGSYAGLVHAGDSVDPAISKFYGDVSERLTDASMHLLFFALELNRVDDAVIERAMQAPELGTLPPLDRGSAQGQAVSARGSRRAAVPREIAERLFRLEPAVRPDHLRSALQGRRQGAGDRADAQPAAGSRRREAQGGRRRRWRRPSRPTSGPSRSSPTRSPRTRRFPTAGADSRMSRIRAISTTASSARWSMRWWLRFAQPIRGCRTGTISSRRAGSKRRNSRIGIATRRCRLPRPAASAGQTRGTWC